MLRIQLEINGNIKNSWEIEENDYIVNATTASLSLTYEFFIKGKEHIFSLDGLRTTNIVGCRIDDPSNYSLCYGYRNGTTDYCVLTYNTATSTEEYLTDSGWTTVTNATTIKSMIYQAPVVDASFFTISTGYTE